MKIILSAVLFFFQFLWAFSDYEKSYGLVAERTVPPYFSSLNAKLRALKPDVLPHEVKILRKEMGDARYYLDLFIYAYPVYENVDVLSSLRRDLDEGYKFLGDYKDLFDILGLPKEKVSKGSYNPKELDVLRTKIFAWLDIYLKKIETTKTKHYLKTPLHEEVVPRGPKSLSRFIWVDGKIPEVKQKTFKNIMAFFLTSLIKKAEERYKESLKVENIFDHSSQESFHDFRKQLRYIVKTPRYFKGLLTKEITEGESFRFLKKTVAKFGDLNDLLTKEAYIFMRFRGGLLTPQEFLDQAKGVFKEIELGWKALLVWQKKNDVLFHLQSLAGSVAV